MSNTFNFVNTNDTTAPLEEGLWGPNGPPTPSAFDDTGSPQTPRVYCPPENPIPFLTLDENPILPVTLDEGDFPGTPAETAYMRTTSQRQALADGAEAQLPAVEDDMAGAPHQEETSMDVDVGLARASSGDSSDDEPLAARLTRVQEELRAEEKRKREEEERLREEERKREEERLREEAKVKLEEFYATDPVWIKYRKPKSSDVGGDEAALKSRLHAWRTALPLWKQAGDDGYLEYRAARKAAREAEEAAAQQAAEEEALANQLAAEKRARHAGFPRVTKRKGEEPEAFKGRRDAQDELYKACADPEHDRHEAYVEWREEETAKNNLRNAKRREADAEKRSNTGSSPAAPRRSAQKAPHAPTPTDFGAVGAILDGLREKLEKSVNKELEGVDPQSQHAADLNGYLSKGKECYKVAMADAKAREGSGVVVPHIQMLQANECWDGITGTVTPKNEITARVTVQLKSVNDDPSASHELALGDILEQLRSKAFVDPDDHAMLVSKILEMADLVAGVLRNEQFQAEARSDDGERRKVLAELQSKGLLEASPHDLARWMMTLDTPNNEAALKILAGGWDSWTQLAILVRTATDPRIPEVEREFGLLREALKAHAETLAEKPLEGLEEGGEPAPALEVAASRQGEEDTQLPKKLANCKSRWGALAPLKREKSAPPEAKKDAQQAFESARKELGEFGAFLKASFLAADGNWRPGVKQQKEIASELNAVKEWVMKQRELEEKKLKGPLTTVDKTFAEKRIAQLGPHFAEQQFDFARGLCGSILEYFNAQCYMYLLVLSTLAPEFCSTLTPSFKRCSLKEDFGRSEATNHEVAAWLLEGCTDFLELERPTREATANFKHHRLKGEYEKGGDMEVDFEVADSGPEAEEATQGLEVTGPPGADAAAGQLEANEATQPEDTQPFVDMVVDEHAEGVDGGLLENAMEIALSEKDEVVEPPKKRRKRKQKPSRDEEGEALQPRTSGRTRRSTLRA